jgi:hypothetical protein
MKHNNVPIGEQRPRGLMIVQHALWYLQVPGRPSGWEYNFTDGDRIAIELLDRIGRKWDV